jgi:hypothetical protein
MPVQRAWHVVVDASATTVEDASLATSRWCRFRDCRRRVTPGRSYYCRRYCCRSR